MRLSYGARRLGVIAALVLGAVSPLAGQEADEDDEDWRPHYEPGKGVVLVDTEDFGLNWTVFSYVRYLNSQGLDDEYTDSFGRTFAIDKRNDLQLNKVNLSFKGFMFDPKLRYLFYVWTANTSQGDPAQVVVAGNIGYQFASAFSLYGGIGALPTTRSTNNTFPNWLNPVISKFGLRRQSASKYVMTMDSSRVVRRLTKSTLFTHSKWYN